MPTTPQFTDIFAQLGFSDEETRLYLFLLEHGPLSVGDIAKRIGQPRASLYGMLERLAGKGVATQSVGKNDVKLFGVEPPQKITLLIRQRIESLQKTQDEYETILPKLLSGGRGEDFLQPKFQVFEGEEGLKHALKDMLLYKDMETQAFWPIKNMVEVLSPEFFRYFNKGRIRNRLATRAIWPKDQTVDVAEHPYLGCGREFLREIRIAPDGVDAAMGYWIYGNRVVCISSRAESFGFIIESAEFTRMLLAQFEVMWNLCTPLVVDATVTQGFLSELKRYA